MPDEVFSPAPSEFWPSLSDAMLTDHTSSKPTTFSGLMGHRLLSILPLGIAWGWTIWACAEHWQGNPNYSYGWIVPVLVAAFSVRRLLAFGRVPDERKSNQPLWSAIVFAAVVALLVWILEFSREQVWHQQLVLWTICVLTAGATLTFLAATGGRRLATTLAFPVLFFLTAVPWPPRLEQPITSTLMQWVALATTELLHWLSIQAQASGGAIALHDGIVGVTEACSGIRSLQAGIMFGLAMGEWFILSTARRSALVGIAVVVAFATNLGRTLLLALHADRHGVASVESVHDMIGNIMITTLIVTIGIVGKLLARPAPAPEISFTRLRALAGRIGMNASRFFGKVMIGGGVGLVVGLVAAKGMSLRLEARDHSQLTAYFTVRQNLGASSKTIAVPREIWNELRPTSGEYIHVDRSDLPLGADGYHFFWKPSPWNRFALVHRPDICMPGIGWEQTNPPEPVQVDFGGRGVRCYAFRFRRGKVHALELWGVWRNGDAVPLDYSASEALGAAAAPAGMQLEGKRRSATEIVACSIISETEAPPTNLAVAVMQSIFDYQKP